MAEQLRMIRTLDNIPEVKMPEGFFSRNYRPEDKEVWLEICKCGLLGKDAGLDAWDQTMLAQKTLVPERDVHFICTAEGKPVATYAAYILDNGVANAHMVAAKEEARGHGLGKVMMNCIMAMMKEQMPGEGRLLGLRTDDWRTPAVVAYLKAGFHPVLYSEGMKERWQTVCDQIDFHGVEMWTLEGEPTGIIL